MVYSITQIASIEMSESQVLFLSIPISWLGNSDYHTESRILVTRECHFLDAGKYDTFVVGEGT